MRGPEDVQQYRRTANSLTVGPVKDVTTVGSEKLTTGQATRSTDMKIWFVMIKDAKGRFPSNDLSATAGLGPVPGARTRANVATDYKPTPDVPRPRKKDDWVYVRGYTALRSDGRNPNPRRLDDPRLAKSKSVLNSCGSKIRASFRN